MREHRQGWSVCRPAIAVVALYALVLQAVLGSAAFAGPFDPSHILCIQDSGSGDGASEQPPVHPHLPCCTIAHVLASASPPVPQAIAVVWPVRPSVAVAYRPEVFAAPRAPPGISASPRAPPAA